MLPAFYFAELSNGAFEQSIAVGREATAIFQGGGGDGAFLQNGAEYAVRDYIFLNGIRPGVIAVAHDAAKITKGFTVSQLIDGIRAGKKLPRWTHPLIAQLQENEFINPEVLRSLKEHERDYIYPPLLVSCPGDS